MLLSLMRMSAGVDWAETQKKKIKDPQFLMECHYILTSTTIAKVTPPSLHLIQLSHIHTARGRMYMHACPCAYGMQERIGQLDPAVVTAWKREC